MVVAQHSAESLAPYDRTVRIANPSVDLFRCERILDIEELKSVPFAPRSHPFIERLIGTLRRENLDQTFLWNGPDLHRKLDRFADYYNQRRAHA